MSREDMLLDLYKIYAYNPNDATGNPLTPFGNFCEGYNACESHMQAELAKRDAVIARKDEALKLARITFIANEMDVRNVMEVLDEALALTPENYNGKDGE